MTSTIDRTFAAFFLRMLLGLIFFMQGFGKVFTWGIENVYNSVFKAYESLLPNWLLHFTAYFTSYVELIAGGLIILGIFQRLSLFLLGVVLLIVAFGHGLKDPIWDLNHVLFRSLLLATVLILPRHWDSWNLYYLTRKWWQ